MQLLGCSNWWLPRALEQRVPQLYVEGRPETFLPAHTVKEPAHA
jgi:putative drug exporter of the RND superfamily